VATRPAVTSESREVSGASATGSTPAPSGTGVVAGEPLAGDGHPDLTPTPGAQARISALPESLAIPAGWLDRLLTLACDLPHDQGEAAVIRAIVAEIQVLVPALRVAVRPPRTSGLPASRAGRRPGRFTSRPTTTSFATTAPPTFSSWSAWPW